MAIRAIVFDFDGVLLESVDIKTNAFRELFKEYPDQVDKIVQLHMDNTGISRFGKFKVIYREYLKRPLDDAELDRLGHAFSRLVLEEVLRCPLVPGARRFLEKYSSQYSLFLASATPREELRDIVAGRGLEAFFKGILGHPPGKASLLRELIVEYGWQPGEVLFVGDALNDYMAAREVGVPFLGRVKEGQSNPFPGRTVVVEDLVQMDREWPSLLRQLSPDSYHRG